MGSEMCIRDRLGILNDEASSKKERVIIRKGPWGIYIEMEDPEDQRCVMLDLFDGELSVKVWADKDNEDFTDKILL